MRREGLPCAHRLPFLFHYFSHTPATPFFASQRHFRLPVTLLTPRRRRLPACDSKAVLVLPYLLIATATCFACIFSSLSSLLEETTTDHMPLQSHARLFFSPALHLLFILPCLLSVTAFLFLQPSHSSCFSEYQHGCCCVDEMIIIMILPYLLLDGTRTINVHKSPSSSSLSTHRASGAKPGWEQ